MSEQTASKTLTQGPLLPERNLPWLVQAEPGITLNEVRDQLEAVVAEKIHQTGAVLFRGFPLNGSAGLQEFAHWFTESFLEYDYGSTPRSKVDGSVYSSTEYPANRTISLHNEMAYAKSWPMRLWFSALEVADAGGETPIADSRQVYATIPEEIREKFAEKKLRYVRNYRTGVDLTWQQAFNTEDPQQMMRFCDEQDIEYTWFGKELRTVQECQAVCEHPVTGEKVWFNQAHLFHVSALEPRLRKAMSMIYKPEQLPRNVLFADGSEIPDADLDVVRGVLDDVEVVFPWQKNDILMIDNMLTAHGRKPFEGSRKTVVVMA